MSESGGGRGKGGRRGVWKEKEKQK
jgi:hypothetical protein